MNTNQGKAMSKLQAVPLLISLVVLAISIYNFVQIRAYTQEIDYLQPFAAPGIEFYGSMPTELNQVPTVFEKYPGSAEFSYPVILVEQEMYILQFRDFRLIGYSKYDPNISSTEHKYTYGDLQTLKNMLEVFNSEFNT